ncbi:MAG TPA: gamma-glutamyltransferase [Dermatophilaceae bacterium]|nr:gamma-glutamyltransferase [Dermatophilaceae bacterium]
MTRRAAVAATSPLAAQAGLDLVNEGGNAVDAAIAAMAVATVAEPGVVSPMGGAFVNVWPASGAPVVVDGNVSMPGRGAAAERFGAGLREVTTSYGGGITLYAGPGSVATPGAFAAFGVAHERFGAAPWARLLEPAIAAATNGFRLGAAAARYLAITRDSVFGWDEQTRAFLSDGDGGIPAPGTSLRAPDLAAALSRVGERGWAELYTGELGEALAADMAARGGLLTRADLAAYRAVVRPALVSGLRDWQVAANPPPSIGGPVLTAMLRLMGEFDDPAERAAAVVRVQRDVLRYRHGRLDRAVDLGEAGAELVRRVSEAGLAGLATSSDTAHVSVVDSDGTACAITASAGYGSGATVPGTGLMLNNCLGEPELNRHGLHALEPGTRLASNMAPTTARRADGSVLAVGSPGADRITTALMQVLSAFCLDGLPLQAAIDRPRLHVRVLDGEDLLLDHEDDPALAGAVADAVAWAGMPVMVHQHRDMFFGGVGAALRAGGGELVAAADVRREAATAVG